MIKKVGVLLSLLFIVWTPLTYGQTQNPEKNFDVTVSPTFVELSSKPNSTINKTVKLRNNTDSELVVKPEIKTLGGDKQGELTIKEDLAEYKDWLKFSNNSQITLKPKEWANVSFTIDVPEDAAFGYYWALSFTSDSAKENKTGANLSASIVVPILLTVEKDGMKVGGKLLDFKTDSFFYEYPPVSFTTQFQNNGNIHIRPSGNVFIKDFLGRTVGTLDINNTQGSILPNLNRTFTSIWNDGFITYQPKMNNGTPVLDKNGKPEQEMKINFQKLLDLRIGKYSATALVVVSGPQQDYTFEKSVAFFVFPWKVVLVIIVLAIFVVIGGFTTGKSFVRKIKKLFSRK